MKKKRCRADSTAAREYRMRNKLAEKLVRAQVLQLCQSGTNVDKETVILRSGFGRRTARQATRLGCQVIHLKVILRGHAKGVGHAVEKCEHCDYVNGF